MNQTIVDSKKLAKLKDCKIINELCDYAIQSDNTYLEKLLTKLKNKINKL